jgi:hypothetical protein
MRKLRQRVSNWCKALPVRGRVPSQLLCRESAGGHQGPGASAVSQVNEGDRGVELVALLIFVCLFLKEGSHKKKQGCSSYLYFVPATTSSIVGGYPIVMRNWGFFLFCGRSEGTVARDRGSRAPRP